MPRITFNQTASNAPSVIAFLPGMTRCGSMSALIIKPESYETPEQSKLVSIVAHDGQNVTDNFPATLAPSEEFNVHIPQTHEAGHWNKTGLEKGPYLPIAPYVQAYFDKFHPKWPFLHPATFDPNTELNFLTQSVVMMGSWAMAENNTQQIAKDLHQRLTSSIYEQRGKWDISNHHDESHSTISSSGPTPWPVATYQGILLHLIFSLLFNHSRSDLQLTQLLPEIPSRLLISLVRSCLKRHMFFYPSILAQFKQGIDPDVFIWLGIEEVKRFDLCLYRVCKYSRVSDTTHLEGTSNLSPGCGPQATGGNLLSLSDLQFAVPDSDELWHATSDLATKLAGNEAAYTNENVEENWISQTARLLQPHDQQFQWI
ncbi:hypothetical protein N7463_008737 [Penicillium fimorum]|uniref:Xylanolytic transcriptional activator regulatory domain-containing protein n=1 Tax=Penicillium fimorum TaxID=1882269 RepID=A0A9X0C412_9EURO|nr:hypothetical protein N7463_008737 [Penicillium fimorum]